MRFASRVSQARWKELHRRRLSHYLRRLLQHLRQSILEITREYQLDFLISASGAKRSGKDTVADVFPWPTVRMAGELRRGLHRLCGVSPDQSGTDAGKALALPRWCHGGPRALVQEMKQLMNSCYPPSTEWPEHVQEIRARESAFVWTHASDIVKERPVPTERVWCADDVKEVPDISVGAGLQVLGTDVGRKLWGEDVWTASYKREVKENKLTSWKTPDTRFDNEGALLNEIEQEESKNRDRQRRLVKISWLVTRPSLTASGSSTSKTMADGRSTTHASEAGLKNYTFEHVLVNDSTLAHLYRTVWRNFQDSVGSIVGFHAEASAQLARAKPCPSRIRRERRAPTRVVRRFGGTRRRWF